MEILENKAEWAKQYRASWLAHLENSGMANWDLYQHPRNLLTPGTKGIKLRQSRLMLISSAGGYLKDEQAPFDAANPYGDYTIRTFPSTAFNELAFAHDHFDHKMIDQDTQVAVPMRLLEEMVYSGEIGELAPSVVSFMGYQPDSERVVDDIIPQILAHAKAENVQAALLAPV